MKMEGTKLVLIKILCATELNTSSVHRTTCFLSMLKGNQNGVSIQLKTQKTIQNSSLCQLFRIPLHIYYLLSYSTNIITQIITETNLEYISLCTYIRTLYPISALMKIALLLNLESVDKNYVLFFAIHLLGCYTNCSTSSRLALFTSTSQ